MTSGVTASAVAGVSITVNDESRLLPPGATVAGLAHDLGLGDRKGIAIAVNGSVVPRGAWAEHAFASGDRVLVIRATQGG